MSDIPKAGQKLEKQLVTGVLRKELENKRFPDLQKRS
jgi:hypothetical protein